MCFWVFLLGGVIEMVKNHSLGRQLVQIEPQSGQVEIKGESEDPEGGSLASKERPQPSTIGSQGYPLVFFWDPFSSI